MTRKFLIVANPSSGSKKAVKLAYRLKEKLDGAGHHFDLLFTKADQSTTEVVREKTNEITDLVVIGGDGTLNQAVNGMSADTTLSIIPAGSGNDFVKNVRIGVSFEKQVHTILEGQVRKIDVGICNDRKFINGVGVGFDGQIVYEMLHKTTLLQGHAAYYYHVLRILGGYKEREVAYQMGTQDLQRKKLILMTIGNGTTFGGGFKLTPNAKLDDGQFDICFVGALSPMKRFLNIRRLSKGEHIGLPEIWEERADKVLIEENPLLEAHIDGEYLGQPPFDIRLLPKALSLRTSAS